MARSTPRPEPLREVIRRIEALERQVAALVTAITPVRIPALVNAVDAAGAKLPPLTEVTRLVVAVEEINRKTPEPAP